MNEKTSDCVAGQKDSVDAYTAIVLEEHGGEIAKKFRARFDSDDQQIALDIAMETLGDVLGITTQDYPDPVEAPAAPEERSRLIRS